MKIKLRFLALGLVALLGPLLASSQRISAYAAADRPSALPAAGASILATSNVPPDGSPAAPRSLAASTVYLPLVMKDYVQGIYGNLNQGGVPIGGISLQLRFYNGASYSTVATTTTNGAGYYLFTGIPALGAGQLYYVLYLNQEYNNSRLWSWASETVTSYTPGSTVALGTSDLANIALVSPSHRATVALPYPFRWSPRAATPSDSYYLRLFNLSTNAYASTISLGYVSTFNMSILPTGFYPNVQYGWYMRVLDANGGYGTSYYYQTVTFSNAGASISGPLNAAPQSAGRPEDLLLPHPHEK